MKRTVPVILAIVVLLVVLLGLSGTAGAHPHYYRFIGYDPGPPVNCLDMECWSKPDGSEIPYPLRAWPAVGYSTASTWYKIFPSVDSAMKTAIRQAESNWEAVWGGNPQMFHWYEDTSPITDNYNRTIGYRVLPFGYVAAVFVDEDPSWHPYQWCPRVGRNVHDYVRWYMRLQSDMTQLPIENFPGEFYAWGTGNSHGILDRASLTTHEFGHTAGLNDIYDIRWGYEPATMYGFADGYYGDRSGTYMRTPDNDDIFGFTKLYPNPVQ